MGGVGIVEFEHRRAHGFAVDVETEVGALEGLGGGVEVPWVGDEDGGGEGAGGAFFTKVLPERSVDLANGPLLLWFWKVLCKLRTFAMIFAPKLNPMPNNGLFGHVSRHHFTICLISHVARAL